MFIIGVNGIKHDNDGNKSNYAFATSNTHVADKKSVDVLVLDSGSSDTALETTEISTKSSALDADGHAVDYGLDAGKHTIV